MGVVQPAVAFASGQLLRSILWEYAWVTARCFLVMLSKCSSVIEQCLHVLEPSGPRVTDGLLFTYSAQSNSVWFKVRSTMVLMLIPTSIVAYEPRIPGWVVQAIRNTYRYELRSAPQARSCSCARTDVLNHKQFATSNNAIYDHYTLVSVTLDVPVATWVC